MAEEPEDVPSTRVPYRHYAAVNEDVDLPRLATVDLRTREGFRKGGARPDGACDDLIRVVSDDGQPVVIEVVPAGYPVNDWDDAGFVLMPLWWLRHRLTPEKYSVVVRRKGRFFQGWNKVVRRERGFDLATARRRAQELAVLDW